LRRLAPQQQSAELFEQGHLVEGLGVVVLPVHGEGHEERLDSREHQARGDRFHGPGQARAEALRHHRQQPQRHEGIAQHHVGQRVRVHMVRPLAARRQRVARGSQHGDGPRAQQADPVGGAIGRRGRHEGVFGGLPQT